MHGDVSLVLLLDRRKQPLLLLLLLMVVNWLKPWSLHIVEYCEAKLNYLFGSPKIIQYTQKSGMWSIFIGYTEIEYEDDKENVRSST